MNDIRDLLPGRMRERTFQLKARRDTGVAWHEPQFVECKQCGRRATRQIWAKSLFVCPNCGNHQPIGAYYRLSLVLDSGSFRERQLPETCPGEQSTYTTATRPHRKMIIPFFHPVCKRVSCLSTGTNQPSFFHFSWKIRITFAG